MCSFVLLLAKSSGKKSMQIAFSEVQANDDLKGSEAAKNAGHAGDCGDFAS